MSAPNSVVTYILEKYSFLALGLDDGYDEVIPPGWHSVQIFTEDDIDLEAAKRLVANGGWRLVKETITREIVSR